MGMRKKRCPRCKKRRRFVEGGADNERKDRLSNWRKINGHWVCIRCATKCKCGFTPCRPWEHAGWQPE